MGLNILSKKERAQKKYRLQEIEKRVEKDINNEIKEEVNEKEANGDKLSKKNLEKLIRSKKKKKNEKVKERLLMYHTTLDAIAPKGNIKFKDVTMTIDGKFETILTFIVRPGSATNLPPLWGINLIPSLKNSERLRKKDIETKVRYSISRRPDEWAKNKISDAVEIAEGGYTESSKASQIIDSKLFKEHYQDAHVIAEEIKNNASYLDLSIRITIKASSIEDLNDAITVLEQRYTDKFRTAVELVPFAGEMDVEYANMLDLAKDQRGENYNLTSKELAGSYPFVKRGVNDPEGTYIGQLAYEVNSDPVLLDGLNFRNLAVICAKGKAEDINNNARNANTNKRMVKKNYNYKATTAWSNKIAQDAIMNGNKAVEFVLNGESPQKLRPELKDITAYINLENEKSGINMFEPFSKGMDELNAYNVLTEKIKAIVRQFSKKEDENDKSGIIAEDLDMLSDILEKFYVYEGMWEVDAKNRREDLRFLNIPHKDVPTLSDFKLYLKEAVTKSEANSQLGLSTSDLSSSKKLYRIINDISKHYSHLFDRKTTIKKERLREANRVIFDFKSLRINAEKALMGQFINAFQYSEQEMDEDDVIIIHGMDLMTDSVKKYLFERFKELTDRDVKIVLMYEDADILFEEKNRLQRDEENIHRIWFRNADMRITNSMSATNIDSYSELLKMDLPYSITRGMTGTDRYIYYMNRDRESVLFQLDIQD